MKILSLDEAQKNFIHDVNPHLWTAVIPAAGRGSRLGYGKPKILYPVAGRTILDRLIDTLDPYCSNFIFILSASGVSEVSPFLNKRLHERCTIAVQEKPKGMADAISKSLPHLSTPYTLIVWGDQVAIHSDTIAATLRIQEQVPDARLTLPLIQRENPYVHYAQDDHARLIRVLERREGASMPNIGESDCGVFACNTAALREIFELELTHGITYSQITREWNFLPMLPRFEGGGDTINGLRITSNEEAVGVNDANDVALLERYFAQ